MRAGNVRHGGGGEGRNRNKTGPGETSRSELFCTRSRRCRRELVRGAVGGTWDDGGRRRPKHTDCRQESRKKSLGGRKRLRLTPRRGARRRRGDLRSQGRRSRPELLIHPHALLSALPSPGTRLLHPPADVCSRDCAGKGVRIACVRVRESWLKRQTSGRNRLYDTAQKWHDPVSRANGTTDDALRRRRSCVRRAAFPRPLGRLLVRWSKRKVSCPSLSKPLPGFSSCCSVHASMR